MAFTERAESWRSKAHLSGARLPVLVGVTALAALVLVFAGKALLDAAASDALVVERAEQEGGPSVEGEEAVAEEARTVVVHVGGAVADPGVRELAEGSRVQDAVDASGGFAEGAASEGAGSGIPTRIRGDRIAGQFLTAEENLALRKLRFLLRLSTALLPDIVFGYKVDISKAKSGYKVDTIISNL